ncbi:class I SAM-dependent methyltransferase [Lacticaseibacillus baoqingensis]|uniref:Class I SAM-dependent methyltransferase n=1 Tax=Lacticaseibacillus baoqingensis TaxID=2486013 RepID=A0ABW4E614_9LACO|nr:class I SAM-dependent methyltransferase [Lacticaseibacillus baoqingensis]
MEDTYPKMRPDKPIHLPTNTGNRQPLWQALAKQAPELAGKRVLALHAGDGWFCRYAINHGAVAVLGVDQDARAISSARDTASSDRLRYRIMPDHTLGLLTGPYDLIVGTFDLAHDDLHAISESLSGLLRRNGQFLAAVTTPITAATPEQGLQLKTLFTQRLTIDALYQLSDTRLQTREQIHFVFSSRSGH